MAGVLSFMTAIFILKMIRSTLQPTPAAATIAAGLPLLAPSHAYFSEKKPGKNSPKIMATTIYIDRADELAAPYLFKLAALKNQKDKRKKKNHQTIQQAKPEAKESLPLSQYITWEKPYLETKTLKKINQTKKSKLGKAKYNQKSDFQSPQSLAQETSRQKNNQSIPHVIENKRVLVPKHIQSPFFNGISRKSQLNREMLSHLATKKTSWPVSQKTSSKNRNTQYTHTTDKIISTVSATVDTSSNMMLFLAICGVKKEPIRTLSKKLERKRCAVRGNKNDGHALTMLMKRI